jgi:hypothetical protein
MSTQDTWNSRIQSAASISGLSTEAIVKVLTDLGLEPGDVSLPDLSDENITQFGDFRAAFGDAGVPIVKIRKAVAALRGDGSSKPAGSRSESLKTKYGIKDGIKTARLQDLVADYDLNEPDDPVGQELKRRFGEAKVIVLVPESETPVVAIAETLDLMADHKDGRTAQSETMVDGVLVETYAVGEKPNVILDEDPLFRGEALRRNGRSNREPRLDWSTVSQEARQFARIAVEIGAIEPTSRRDSKDIHTFASQGIKALSEEFLDVGLEFRRRKHADDLPKLKVVPGSYRKNQPFGIGNRTR